MATNVLRVGDPVRLTVNITNRGDAPLARLVPPPAPTARDWQVVGSADFAPAHPVRRPPLARLAQGAAPAQPNRLQGVVTFTYTLVPLSEAARATPPIPFSCYDPDAGVYKDLTIPSVPVTVKAGAAPGDFASLQQAGALGSEPEKELVLSGLAASRGRSARSLVPPQKQAWFPFLNWPLQPPSSAW